MSVHHEDLGALAADATGQLDVLGHDGDTLGVNGAQVGVLKEANQVSLTGLLQSHDSGSLEAKIGLEVLSDLTHQALEGQLADEKLGALLVATDLTQGNGSRPVAMRLLDPTSGGSRLAGSLGGQLLARGLSPGAFAGGLLRASHVAVVLVFVEREMIRAQKRCFLSISPSKAKLRLHRRREMVTLHIFPGYAPVMRVFASLRDSGQYCCP